MAGIYTEHIEDANGDLADIRYYCAEHGNALDVWPVLMGQTSCTFCYVCEVRLAIGSDCDCGSVHAYD